MQAVILAGGLGTRLSEETHMRPKPMVEIGGKPILWHILKSYSKHGVNDFIICCGYKGYMIKEYFANYYLHMSDVTFNMREGNEMTVHQKYVEPWNITLVDTGEITGTGGRLKRVRDYIYGEDFCFTYGDGVANIDILKVIEMHKINKARVTLTAVQPPGRYGALKLNENKVVNFQEKPEGDNAWINGGYFVVKTDVVDEMECNSELSWEENVLPRLTTDGEVFSYKHSGFWQAMDTLRDKIKLEKMWEEGKAPWKVW